MIRTCRFFFLAIALAVTDQIALAQVTTGTPPFGSFSGGPDVVNNANLNVHWKFPMIQKPGRGTNFNYALSYDTSVWYPAGVSGSMSWNRVANWGWPSDINGFAGQVTYQLTWTHSVIATCGPGGTQEVEDLYTYSNWVYTDPHGTAHAYNGSSSMAIYSGCSYTTNGSSLSETAHDGSGFQLYANPDTNGPCSPCHVTDKIGEVFNLTADGSGQQTRTDSNGNTVSVNNLQFTDTFGQTALAIAGQPPNPVTFTYSYRKPDGTTGSAAYTVNFRTYSVRTGFGCNAISEYGPTSNALVDYIQLPNGKKYSFQYELTPDQTTYPGDVTGRVAKVTLPTGGSIAYTYTGANYGANCADGSTLNLTRAVSDGVTSNSWTYARTLGNPATTTITAPQLPYDPAANQTVLSFDANNHETSRKIYQGSATGNPLRTYNTTWASNNTPSSRVTILEDGQKQQETDPTYDALGNRLQLLEYDWGTGTRGPLVRQTLTTLVNDTNYTLKGLVSLVARQTVEDNSGTPISRVDFAYDDAAHEATCRSTPVTGHDDANYGCSFHYRGNRTSVTTYTDPVTPAGAITRYTSYDQLGNVVSADLSCCQQKTWSYSTTTDYAYADSITRGSSAPQLTTSSTYDLNMGLVLTSTDENNQTSTFTYDSMGRVTDVKRPDNQHVTYSYDDTNLIVQVTSPVQGTNTVASKTYLDGLGRVIKTQVLDGNNNSYSISETKYDALGRTYKTSNPHNSTAQYWTETRFDALGRPVKTILQDGSQSTVTYMLNTVTTADPAGKQRQTVSDGLGRLTIVYEPDPSNNNALTVPTSYAYNLLDKLTLVTQGAQTRTYAYDALGRPTSSTTPEAGTICIGTLSGNTCQANGYDSFNNVLYRTDARGVQANYIYDGLNRLLGVSYTNVPPSVGAMPNVCITTGSSTNNANVCYTYGTNAASYNNGRLVSITDPSGSESYTYNQFGNVTQLAKVIGSVAYTTNYAYNLGNQLTQITYPSGRAVAQNLDPIGRLSSIVGTLNSTNTTYASGFLYNTAQRPTGFQYGNNLYASFGFSSDRLQPTCIDYSTTNRNGACINDSTTIFGLQYGYPASPANNGQISGINDTVDNGRSTTYSYDSLYRLTLAVATGSTNYPAWGLQWSYDRYGNRTAQSVYSGCTGITCPTNSVTVSASTNQVTGSPYAYDTSGNMTNDGSNTLAYDGENRTTSATNGSSAGAYSYDGNGLRVKKCVPNCTSPTTTTVYVFSNRKVIAEYDNGVGPSSPSREYIYAGGKLVAKIESAGTNYYHQDHLSNRLVTDVSGNTVSQRGHYPFGESWYESGTTTKLKFTSYERDTESGNDYALARYYINRLGRFASPDPRDGHPDNPQSWNHYSYVLNDPVNLNDMDGEGEYCSWDDGTWDDPNPDGGASAGECIGQGGTWVTDAPPEAPDLGNPDFGNPGNFGLDHSNTQPPAPPGYEDCITGALEEMIAHDEGMDAQPNDGYGALVGGRVTGAPHPFHWIEGQYFSPTHPWNMSAQDLGSLTGHPDIMVRVGPGLNSTAFGRYQILVGTASDLAPGGGAWSNWSPSGQDDAGAILMDRKGMIADAMSGQIVQAIWDGNTTWASLPDSPYNQGNGPRTWAETIAAFQDALNYLPECQ